MKLLSDANQTSAVDHSNPREPKTNLLESTNTFVPPRLASRIEMAINPAMLTKHGIIGGKRSPDNAKPAKSITPDTNGSKNSNG